MIIVADASPLIFLGKIGQLEIIHSLFKGEILVPSSIRDEVIEPPIPPAEERMLKDFLLRCRIVNVVRPEKYSSAMSRSDNDALTLATRKHADLLLADERIMRDMAIIEHIRPVGTLGLLLMAMRNKLFTAAQTRQLVEDLVQNHHFRISITLYDSVMKHIAAG
jgi:predicted nucleic acid-binding protein